MKAITLFIFLNLLFANILVAQTRNKSIHDVENNLMPYVPVKGFAGWNIYERMKYYKIPGLSIAVIKDYKIDWLKSYGLADTIKKIPVTNQTLFSAGSISKMVMAAAALQLVEKGKLSLDSPINNYLTSWKIKENDFTRKTPITLRMLLSHTGGTSQSAYWGFTPDVKRLPTVVETLSGAPVAEANPVVVNSQPAKEFRYSGGGTMIAQLAMMDVTKTDFAAYIQKKIFTPLAMKDASFLQPLPPAMNAKAAWGYSAASWYKGMPYVYPQQAAAGLYTTAKDLALFIIALQKSYAGKSNLLSVATMKQMFSPQAIVSEGQYKEQVALGAFLLQLQNNNDDKGKYFEHQGANAGFISYAMGSVEGGNGVVIMMNTGDDFNGFGKELRRSVAKVYNWPSFFPDEVTPVSLPEDQLTEYEGRYRKGEDEVITIRKEKNYLVETINEGNAIYCFPVAKDSIVFTDYNIPGFFTLDANGVVNGLQSQWQQTPMLKMKDDEFSPGEHLRAGRYQEAKKGYAAMKMNEYQVTGFAYELLAKRPMDASAVKTILEVAKEQHPKSSLMFARWGDYYAKTGDKAAALKNYKMALELDPGNKELIKLISGL